MCIGDHQSLCSTICGDGVKIGDEQCDDGNFLPLDGCRKTSGGKCEIEPGFSCKEDFNRKSICMPLCGNGVLDSNEECDDLNMNERDGCSSCKIDKNYFCVYGNERSNCKLRP